MTLLIRGLRVNEHVSPVVLWTKIRILELVERIRETRSSAKQVVLSSYLYLQRKTVYFRFKDPQESVGVLP